MARTIQDLYTELCHELGDTLAGTTTAAGTTTSLVDSSLAYGATNDWNGSEVVLFTAGGPDTLVARRVTASDNLNGTLTFTPALASPPGTGTAYLLTNHRGVGRTHRQKMAAMRAAFDYAAPATTVYITTTIAASRPTTVMLPSNCRSVHAVYVRPRGQTGEDWTPIAPHAWEVLPATFQVVIHYPLPVGATLRVDTRMETSWPTNWTTTLAIDPTWLKDYALARLLLMSPEASDRQRASAQLGLAERRAPRPLPLANEVRL